MHTIVLGKFGSGKSKYGVQKVIECLRFTNRNIVTTLALNLPALNEYMQRKWPGKDFRVFQRVLVLTTVEQMRVFWRYRGVAKIFSGEYGVEAEIWGPCGNSVKDQPQDERWNNVSQGVEFHIDEATAAFKAREFMKTGVEFTDFCTQHRKVDCDIYSYARQSGMLEKQFRDTADRCIIMENWYQKLVKGFTAPRKIVGRVYENCPPLPGEDSIQRVEMTIDPQGVDACYDTRKGIGIAGTGTADMGKTAKGIPWWTVFPAAVAAGVIGWFIVSRVMHLGASWGAKKASITPVATATTNQPPPPTANTNPPAPQFAGAFNVPFATPPGQPKPWVPPVPPTRQATGWAVINNALWIHTPNRIFRANVWSNYADAVYADGFIWERTKHPESFNAGPRFPQDLSHTATRHPSAP